MRRSNPCWMGLLGLALVVAAGCTDNALDDGGGPNVVLGVVTQTTPDVTGQIAAGSCSVSANPCFSIADCPQNETCVPAPPSQGCQIPDWNFTIRNSPLTPLGATQPFNNVVIETVTVFYDWPNPFISPSFVIPVGVTIPADSQAPVTFSPVSQDIILNLGAPSGTPITAQLSVLFEGHVLDGDGISLVSGGVLQVQACF